MRSVEEKCFANFTNKCERVLVMLLQKRYSVFQNCFALRPNFGDFICGCDLEDKNVLSHGTTGTLNPNKQGATQFEGNDICC
mmetsp:Transcript_15076/g.29636  ORF Transcript_15076/g.29636 Transcript_15076/m.29636 type:complete len:82 (+) Transcript_15076:2467-2712(+)